MIKYLKKIIFIFLTLSFALSFAQKKVVEPVLKIYGKDGITRYYKGGILVKIDSNLSHNTNSLKSNKYLSNNAPIFQFGLGKSDQVAMDWGNYHFDKESYKKAIERFSSIENKNVDVLRKLGKSYLNLNNLDSSERYYKIVAEKTNNSADWYNYSHTLYMNDKFDEAEYIRSKYAYSSKEKRADIFKNNKAHTELLDKISKVDLVNLSINTKNSDFGAYAVKNDSTNTYYTLFTSANVSSLKEIKKSKFVKPDQPTYDIYKTQLNYPSLEVSSSISLSGQFSNEYQEGPAIITEDQQTVYFTRSNSLDADDDVLYLSLYSVSSGMLDQQDSIIPFSINDDHYSVMHPTISNDGKKIFFSSNMSGGFGGLDLYYCYIEGVQTKKVDGNLKKVNKLSDPINLGNRINTEGNEVFPYIMNDDLLFYSSDGRLGLGGLDIFVANNYLDTSLIKIDNLGKPFNSPKDDFSFFISKDIKFGFLSSNRFGGKGDDDIYCFKLNLSISEGTDDYYTMVKGETLEVNSNSVLNNDFLNDADQSFLSQNVFYKAKLINKPSNGKINFKSDGTFIYTPNNDSVTVDVFTYRILNDQYSNDTINVFIKALDQTVPVAVDDHYVIKKGENFSTDSINGTLHNDSDSGGDILTTILLDSTLHGEIDFKKDGSFTYIPEDYYVESDTFTYIVTDGLYYDTAEVTLARLVSGVDIATIIEIDPIYFDVNKSNIRDDAATELLKIVKVMNDYPSMVVELGSHTDCRASKTYNRNLSDRRAKSSARFIKERISKPERIYGKGFGESKLKNECECEGSRIVPCSEEEHQENRRTEFVIKNM
jgi:outer membrane protein OmpA-like peptidoglycan-associated protein/tetratricopeptide (TPR) repeat protein